METMTDSGAHDQPQPSEDGRLVQRTLNGDQTAFETLVRRYERLVFRIAGGFLRDRGEVEDIAQDAFLRAYEALPRFRIGSPFAPWIAQIATRLCYDRLRKMARRDVTWEDLSPAERQTAEALVHEPAHEHPAATRDLAERLLATVSPRDRQVLILSEAMGYSAAETAKILGCTALAARLRLHRAKRAVREAAAHLLKGMRETS
jgi:RNA polymerase sigma-70 factor (ECF subfamily)